MLEPGKLLVDLNNYFFSREEKNERGSAKSGSDRGRSASKMNASPSGQTPVIPPMESEDSTEQEPQRRIPLVSRKTLESRESKPDPSHLPVKSLSVS